MFVALLEDYSRLELLSLSLEEIRKFRGRQFKCHLCEQEMVLKAGDIITPHFAHKDKCPYENYARTNESEEHIRAKAFLMKWLPFALRDMADVKVESEFPVHPVRRIADLIIESDTGWGFVFEVQLSAITVEEIRRRTNDYLRAGLNVLWFLGGDALKSRVLKGWVLEAYGFIPTLRFCNNTVEIDYLNLGEYTREYIRRHQPDEFGFIRFNNSVVKYAKFSKKEYGIDDVGEHIAELWLRCAYNHFVQIYSIFSTRDLHGKLKLQKKGKSKTNGFIGAARNKYLSRAQGHYKSWEVDRVALKDNFRENGIHHYLPLGAEGEENIRKRIVEKRNTIAERATKVGHAIRTRLEDQIRVCGFHEEPPPGFNVIDITYLSCSWSRELSPLLLGPCPLYGGYVAQNVENAWSFSHVYEEHALDGNPTEQYFEWAQQGWGEVWGHRYPMGKDRSPLFFYWEGKKQSVSESRKVFAKLYAKAVVKTYAFGQVKIMAENGDRICFKDFNGYDYTKKGMTLKEAIQCPDHQISHGFVLALLLGKTSQEVDRD